jgi:hypothetical protein
MIKEYIIGEPGIGPLYTPQFIISNPLCLVNYEMKITKNGNDVTANYDGALFKMVAGTNADTKGL